MQADAPQLLLRNFFVLAKHLQWSCQCSGRDMVTAHYCRVEAELPGHADLTCKAPIQVPDTMLYPGAGRMGYALLSLALGAILHLAQCQFVVETNSMRVREPAAVAGEFDVAIGDVRLQEHLLAAI